MMLTEYFTLGMFFLFLVFVMVFHLHFPLPIHLHSANIHWILMVFGLQMAAFPVFILMVKAVLNQIQFLRKALLVHPTETLMTDLTVGHQQEWEAVKQGIKFLRDWLPAFVFMGTYYLLGSIPVLLKMPLRDALLAQWDLKLFGAHYSVLAQRFYSPWTTAIMNFCYFMHVVLYPMILVLFYLKKKWPLFHRTMLFLILSGFLGEIGYILVPAYGPGVYLSQLYSPNPIGNPFAITFLDFSKISLDAFPSLHIAISTGSLVYARQYGWWFFWVLLPLVVGNWLSTIYLQYHYTVDLLAGFVVFGLAYAVTEISFYFWEKQSR